MFEVPGAGAPAAAGVRFSSGRCLGSQRPGRVRQMATARTGGPV